MKKPVSLFMCLLAVFSLCACGNVPPAPQETDGAAEVVSKGTGFEVSQRRTDTGTKYYYTVTAADGSVIEHASCAEQPKVAPMKNGLLGIRFYTETDSWCRYYDLNKGLSSESFFRAFWDNGRLVAYNDFEQSGKLIVREIFSADGYRCEIPIEASEMELTVSAAVPSDDGSVLTVEYVLGRSGNRRTVDIPLE